jgi:hypothetical protein
MPRPVATTIYTLGRIASLVIALYECELAQYAAQTPQNTEHVRTLSQRVDGARFAKALIHNEHLEDKKGLAHRRDMIRLLGVAEQTAAMCYVDGFSEGLNGIRLAIVRTLEGKEPLKS